MKTVEIKPGIYWVGAIDWAIRDFHGYVTPNGTTYNNYLVLDKQITLSDTVKYDFAETTIDNIRSLIDPSEIKHIVINHIENDHVTGIERIMDLTPSATIHITNRGKKGLDRFFDTSKWDIRIVKTGDTLNIGGHCFHGNPATGQIHDDYIREDNHYKSGCLDKMIMSRFDMSSSPAFLSELEDA
jgi:flavorubredoxin